MLDKLRLILYLILIFIGLIDNIGDLVPSVALFWYR